MSSWRFCLFTLYFVWNEPDADERLHICQLYCSISISMPTNDDHSFLSQMLRFAMYSTTCNCNESCKNLLYVFTLKVVKALAMFLYKIMLGNVINKMIDRNSYLVHYLWDLLELIQFLNITLVIVVVSFYGFVNTKDNLSDPETI